MATTQIAAQKLGKLPPRVDVRTLSLKEYVDPARLPEPPDVLVHTVRSTFPAHEHDHFVAHYRGLLAAWARDQQPV
jgi:hypothetical protein